MVSAADSRYDTVSRWLARFADGSATPVDHVAACRAAACDHAAIHAVAEADWDAAESAAREAEIRWRRGEARPLEGIVFGVKSNIALRGFRWSAGIAGRTRRAAQDAEIVARLRDAGAIALGTLSMHEGALGATGWNEAFGIGANAHDPGRTPGGSSGGSGAAVAAGICAFALGTDTMGSVRIPAAYNGVFGLKPGHGLLCDHGIFPLLREWDCAGPLARSAACIDAVMAVLDPHWSAAGAETEKQWRPLVLEDLGGVSTEPAVIAAFERALACFPPAPQTVALPPLHDVRFAGFLRCAEALESELAQSDGRAGISAALAATLDHARGRVADNALLAETARRLTAAIGDDGVLIMPTAPQAAFPLRQHGPANQADFTCLANIGGFPAISFPAGRSDAGMPVAVQLVGPRGSELPLVAMAQRLEASLQGYRAPVMKGLTS